MANSRKSVKHSRSERNVEPDVYEVERILADRINNFGENEYYIKWTGYDSYDNTWEPEENLIGASMALKDWQKRKGLVAAGLLQPYNVDENEQKKVQREENLLLKERKQEEGGKYPLDLNLNTNEPLSSLSKPAAKSRRKSKTKSDLKPKAPRIILSEKRVTKRRLSHQQPEESGNEQTLSQLSNEKKKKSDDQVSLSDSDLPSAFQSESYLDSPSLSHMGNSGIYDKNAYSQGHPIGSPTSTSSIAALCKESTPPPSSSTCLSILDQRSPSLNHSCSNSSVSDHFYSSYLEQSPTPTSISRINKADPSVSSHTIVISEIAKTTAEEDILSYFAFIPSKLDVRFCKDQDSSKNDIAYVKFDSADYARIAYGKGHPSWRIALVKDDVYSTFSDPLQDKKSLETFSSSKVSKGRLKSTLKPSKYKSASPRKPKNELKVLGSRWTTINNIWQEMPKTDATCQIKYH
ncbi:chromodomain protein Chp1 [Schizosaccharomyces cryophilus OY26]|uniref:Chromodomain protein Chp1 n=1 Tax=Schizosaccharomyces cryophilus (strain OY26 / ATCC MYA-4695 / CBS 11777 / NBRC 106824 / NRRL Y48691) TaxID=653667 RepID=S9X3V0_SCHCR|nr:chromodomain protein Chp1 [Schizosaccharomyces cryophilus OY26]EPY51782.1 chromodomain protein Chp1 [Schizosaccharomyces cryophilus OY26]